MPADMGAPRAARGFVADHLAGGVLPDGLPVSDVVLVVSELVTNAVEAGASTLELSLAVTPRRLELVVEDDAAGWPVRAEVPADATHGRGLNIVAALSDRWQVTGISGGKRVTASWSWGPGLVVRPDPA